MTYQKILLASHGTRGARAAELYALDIAADGGHIDHLEIVPDFWKGMMGDDWLNNSSTQIVFGEYVENQLENEIQERMEKVKAEVEAAGFGYSAFVDLGKPTDCLVKQSLSENYDVIIIGSPRPKGEQGYRSRIHVDELSRAIKAPLLIVPFPL
ncbi:MAG: universal stress protein [Gammaproteobacteria bacterium]|nr:universal stress protein [Gammaproteobacteria bacterium]